MLDQALVDAAVEAGRDVPRPHPGHAARGVRRRDRASRPPPDGPSCRRLIGADGSAGVAGRHVGVRIARTDLGLEVELAGVGADWEQRVHLDWGTDAGTYGWVFPKADRLTVGVIQRKGEGAATRAYLARLLDGLGLADHERLHDSGHLTRWREPGSPVRRGAVLVAGDAAGLLEPWTREGISFALRSGLAAGAAAADGDLRRLRGVRRARARAGAARGCATAPALRARPGPRSTCA